MSGPSVTLRAELALYTDAYRQGCIDAAKMTEQTGQKIQGEWDKVANSIDKKFSGGFFARSMLSGVGLGSGFAVAQKAAEMISGYWKEAADAAKSIADSSDKQLASLEQMLRLRRDDSQELTKLAIDQNRLYKELVAITPHATQTPVLGKDGLVVGMMQGPAEYTNKQSVQRAAISAQLEALGVQQTTINKKIGAGTAAAGGVDTMNELIANHEKMLANQKEVDAEIEKSTKATRDYWDEQNKAAEAVKRLIDPTLEFKEEIAKTGELMMDGVISFDEGTAAIAKFNEEIAKTKELAVDKALAGFFDDLDRLDKSLMKEADQLRNGAEQIGMAFTSAFEDAVLNGTKFSDVLKSLEKDLLRIALRASIEAPFLKMFTGSAMGTGMASLFGFAGGGSFSGNSPFMVGENGPEIIVPGGSGTVIPNGKLGGDTYYIDAKGADQTAVDRLERVIVALNGSIEHRAVAAVVDAKRRPGGAGRYL